MGVRAEQKGNKKTKSFFLSAYVCNFLSLLNTDQPIFFFFYFFIFEFLYVQSTVRDATGVYSFLKVNKILP